MEPSYAVGRTVARSFLERKVRGQFTGWPNWTLLLTACARCDVSAKGAVFTGLSVTRYCVIIYRQVGQAVTRSPLERE